VRKFRVWTLRQFYHFLSLHGYGKNIAKKLPYTKIEKAVPYSHEAIYDKEQTISIFHELSPSPRLHSLPSYEGHIDLIYAIILDDRESLIAEGGERERAHVARGVSPDAIGDPDDQHTEFRFFRKHFGHGNETGIIRPNDGDTAIAFDETGR
jgi:hypothetical protein